LKGITLLSFARRRLAGICGSRGLRPAVRRLRFAGSRVCFLDDHPEKPVQIRHKGDRIECRWQ
jgi:hypothetical protein